MIANVCGRKLHRSLEIPVAAILILTISKVDFSRQELLGFSGALNRFLELSCKPECSVYSVPFILLIDLIKKQRHRVLADLNYGITVINFAL